MQPKAIQSICVYCGSADGFAAHYLEAAAQMGRSGETCILGGEQINQQFPHQLRKSNP